GGGGGIEHRRVGGDRDGLGLLPNLKLNIDANAVAGRDPEVLANIFLETGRIGFHPIGPRRQKGNGELAIQAGVGHGLGPRGHQYRDNLGVWNRRRLDVNNPASDGSTEPPRADSRQEDESQKDDRQATWHLVSPFDDSLAVQSPQK